MNLLKLSLAVVFVFFLSATAFSQNTAISDVSYTPNASAVLDVYSTSKGMLAPRLLQAQRTAIASPANGLLVYQTDGIPGFYYYDGSTWTILTSGTAWVPGGNSVSTIQTIGTTSNYDLPLITNNTEKMRITTSGNVGIGTSTFSTLNPEKFLVECGNTTSTVMGRFRGFIDNYLDLNIQNQSDGINASTNFTATANNGTDSTNLIKMGINGSNYAPGTINFGGPNDGYLYSNSRNLIVGTTAANSDVIFMVNGGQINVNQAMRIEGSTRNIIIGKKDGTSAPLGNILRGPNGGGTNVNGGDITVQGGKATGTGTGGMLNLFGGGTVTGTYGPVNINKNTNSATNINTGTSNKDVTIGGTGNNIFLPKFTTVGGVFYTSASTGQIATNANLTWNNSATRLGLGTSTPAATLDVSGTSKLGTSGSVITNLIKTNVSVTNTTVFSYNTIQVVAITVVGANLNASVIVNPRITLPVGIGLAYSYVSAADTVTLVFTNTDATARAVGTGVVFDITVIN